MENTVFGKAVLRDTSTIFPFGHMKEGSCWPEFSEGRIRNQRRKKREWWSPQGSNMDGKHPWGRRKTVQIFFFLLGEVWGLCPFSSLELPGTAPFCDLQVMTLIWLNKDLNISSTNHLWLFSGITQVAFAKSSGDAICNRGVNYCLYKAAENVDWEASFKAGN